MRPAPFQQGRASGVTGGSRPDARPRTLPWLATRATFGFSTKVERDITQRGHDGWLDWQLAYELIDDSALDQKLAAYPWLTMSAQDIINDGTLDTVELGNIYKGLRLLRAVESRRQLFERVVAFWEDHFNVTIGRFLRFVEDEPVWRAHALGSFRSLLGAVTKSASMIAFLNNELNVSGANNENLAREIFELHTLGVTGPYTETDVREFTRVLTGWTYDLVRTNPTFGQPLFDPALHDTSPKTVLGVTYAGGTGPQELESILDVLAMHPSTITYVTGKLAQFFLGDDPPRQVVEDARLVWLNTNGDLRKVVRELLREQAITALAMRGSTKFRRPFDWMASLFRATGVELPAPLDSYAMLRTLGQSPFEWGPPDGYPDKRESWAGFVQPRWVIAADFARPAGAPWNHTPADLMPLVLGIPRDRWARRLSAQVAGGRLSAFDVQEIQAHVDSLPPTALPEEVLGEALELVLSCPSYQTL